MRYPDGALVGDANDNFQATSSVSLSPLVTSSLNENLTSYDLLPVIVNKTPTVVATVVDGSTPPIKSIHLVDGSGQSMYVNASGVVRVCIGTSITLRFAAQQPDKLNVENGLLVMIPDQTDLVYTWKVNDIPLADFQLGRLRSSLMVDRGECVITNIQITHSGTYQCEVSNDIGSVLSEAVVIEVYNPDADPKLHSNLITNPYGQDGVDGWNASTSEFVTKEMSTTSAEQFKVVNNINVFGYTADMMHPRPYQLNPGVIRGVDLASNLTRRGTYFSRAPYKFLARGGSTYVKAYQDIDLSDLVDLIAGGVYGIGGLRGIFGCYIGTGISNYAPTEELTPINNRKNRREHFFGAPRLSVENWLAAGQPELIDRAYVTIEEFQDETRLASRLLNQSGQSTLETRVITLHDPYTKAINQAPSTPYYPGSTRFPTDQYELGFTSPGERVDRILHAADSLMPNYEDRFTFGQYVEFNRVILDKLNPKTNKIRVALNFFCEDYKLIEPGTLSELGSDEVWDFSGWSRPAKKNTFGELPSNTDSIFDRLNTSDQIPATEKFLTQPDPRPIITGLVLGLVPILNEKPNLTSFYTNQALSTNNVQQSEVTSQLLEVPFDPFERRLKRLYTTFSHQSSFSSSSADITAINFQVEPNQGIPYQLPILDQRLFPFTTGLPVDFHIGGSTEDDFNLLNWRVVSTRRGDLVSAGDWGSLLARTGSTNLGTSWSTYTEVSTITRNLAAANLSSNLFAKATDGPAGGMVFDENGSQSIPNEWNGKARYILHYVVRDKGVDNAESNLILTVNTSYNSNQNYNDEVISSNEPLVYNSYLLEIKHPTTTRDTDSIVTLSRTTEMVGSGSLDPIEVEHGINSQGDFYFKLPNEVLYNNPDQGGLGLALFGRSITEDDILSLSSSLPNRNPDKAVSLYAVQAVGYGAVSGSDFGGTPVLGYDTGGSYYQVEIRAIQDNIIHEGTFPLNLEQ